MRSSRTQPCLCLPGPRSLSYHGCSVLTACIPCPLHPAPPLHRASPRSQIDKRLEGRPARFLYAVAFEDDASTVAVPHSYPYFKAVRKCRGRAAAGWGWGGVGELGS